MRNLKIFLPLILLIVPLITQAQRWDVKEMAKREKENLFKKVSDLSPIQTELINGIYEEYGDTMKETFDEIRKTRNWKEIRPKMDKLKEEKDLLIKDVLKDEDYAIYLKVAQSDGPKPGGQQQGQGKPGGNN